MTDLSPAAQAVLDAHDNAPYENFVAADRLAVAAALRAAADQVVPHNPKETMCFAVDGTPLNCMAVRYCFFAIADRLGAVDD